MKLKLFSYLIVVSILLISCEKQDMADPAFKEEIESYIGLNFPASICWINYELSRGMDYAFIASFTLPKSEIKKVFKEDIFSWSSDVRRPRNIEGVKWFKPNEIKKFKSFEMNYPKDNHVLRVIYEDEKLNPETHVLFYLEWFEMW